MNCGRRENGCVFFVTMAKQPGQFLRRELANDIPLQYQTESRFLTHRNVQE
jgi:hypothetical protein